MLDSPLGKAVVVVIAFAAGLAASIGLARLRPGPMAPLTGETEAAQEPRRRHYERIICMSPAATEIIFAIGGGPQVVGVSQHTVWPPEALDRPRCGGFFNPSYERILNLEPDLIVTQGEAAGLSAFGESHGIDVFRLRLTDLDSIFAEVNRVGRILGQEAGAELVSAEMRYRLARVRARIADRRPVPVLLVTGRQADTLSDIRTAGKGTFLHDLVEAAGGLNTFGDMDESYGLVNKEALVERAPEVIVELHGEGGDPAKALSEARAAWGEMASLPAVRQGRIHVIEATYAMIPGPRVVELAERLAKMLHPEEAP